jgi:beta-lactamase class A
MPRKLLAITLWSVPLLAGPPAPSAVSRLAALEARVGGRLGVAVLDTGTGRRLEYRSAERFPLCSTFKVLLAGAVLSRVDRGLERLDRSLPYGPADLLEYAPVTRAHVAEGRLTVGELCAAAVVVSDNTAANLLLGTLGGPAAITAFARSLGDAETRLDRLEPDLNEALPGDPRDTTTPDAMAAALRALLLGPALAPASRQRLEDWMVAATTGRNKLRAGLPPGWIAGDKTGSGARGTMNDVALVRPPGQAPILVSAYLTGSQASWADREAVLAEVGRLVGTEFADPKR